MRTRVLIFALIACAIAQAAPVPRGVLAQEIERLWRSVEAKPDDDNWKPVKPDILANLKIASGALNAGQILLALDAVNIARSNYRGIENTANNPEIVKNGVDAFMTDGAASVPNS